MSSRCPESSPSPRPRSCRHGACATSPAVCGAAGLAADTSTIGIAIAAVTLVAACACGSAQAQAQAGGGNAGGDARTLRVCAEPDNLPFSDAAGQGFENRIAALVAAELHVRLMSVWQPQRRGFVRRSVGAGLCEVWIGVPAGFPRLLTTRPYYRSRYVFLNRADAALPLRSFDDPRLRGLPGLRIGVQLIGDDLAATPAALALARSGATAGVVGYPVYGAGPAAGRIGADLAAGKLDAALVWGPQAGWLTLARPDGGEASSLVLSPALPPAGFPLPLDFEISMGVGRGDRALRDELDGVLERRAADITAILDEYAVPRLAPAAAAAAAKAAGAGEASRAGDMTRAAEAMQAAKAAGPVEAAGAAANPAEGAETTR